MVFGLRRMVYNLIVQCIQFKLYVHSKEKEVTYML